MSRDQSPLLPAEIDVVWMARRCAGLPSDGYPESYTSTVELKNLDLTDSTIPRLDGRSGSVRMVRSLGPALFSDPIDDPTNKTALDSMAKKYAQDWFDWETADLPGDLNVGGIVAPTPNGLIDCIEWTYTKEDTHTRVMSAPFNGSPIELAHYDPAAASCGSSTGRYGEGPQIFLEVPVGEYGTLGAGSFIELSVEGGRPVISAAPRSTGATGCACISTPPCGTMCMVVNDCDYNPLIGQNVTLKRRGTITSLELTNGGSGYTAAPDVVFDGGTFLSGYTSSSVNAYTTIDSSGKVSSINIRNHGEGYATAPNVRIGYYSPHGGSGATATCTVGDVTLGSGAITQSVQYISMLNHGSGYTPIPPNVSISGGGGSGATAHAVMQGGGINDVTVVSGGGDYDSPPAVTVTDSGGTGHYASVTANLNGSIRTITVTNGGSGYGSSPTISFYGTGSGAAAHAVVVSGVITAIIIDNPGTNYNYPPSVNIYGAGVGSGATATCTILGPVHQLQVFNRGSFYTNPVITVDPPAGGGPAAVGTTTPQTINVFKIVVDTRGSGFTSTPTLTIDPPTSGTTATGTVYTADQYCVDFPETGIYEVSTTPGGGYYTLGPAKYHAGGCTEYGPGGLGGFTPSVAVLPSTTKFYIAGIVPCNDSGIGFPFYAHSLISSGVSVDVLDSDGVTVIGSASPAGSYGTVDVPMPRSSGINQVYMQPHFSGAWATRMSPHRQGPFGIVTCPNPPPNTRSAPLFGAYLNEVYLGFSSIDFVSGYQCVGNLQYPIPNTLSVSGGGSGTLTLKTCSQYGGGTPYAAYVGTISIPSGGSRGQWKSVWRTAYSRYNECCPDPQGGNITVRVELAPPIGYLTGGLWSAACIFPVTLNYPCNGAGENDTSQPPVIMTWDASAWCRDTATDPSPPSALPSPLYCWNTALGYSLSGSATVSDVTTPPFDLSIPIVPGGVGNPVPGFTLHFTE